MFTEHGKPNIKFLRKRFSLFSPEGQKTTFFLNHENGGIVISQEIEKGKEAHWQPHDKKGNPVSIKNTNDAIKFLGEQEYKMYTKQKGGNDK